MEFNNIFNKNNIKNPSRITYENEDFDVTQSCLESLLIIEDAYYEINKNHIQATHIALKEQNIQILTEGFGDFINSVVKFFDNLLKRFKEFMRKVFMVINAYFGDFDKFLSKYR
jgi:hypothetical protein